ncbi:MAG: CBS domain-containing protein [Thermoplasmatales archaeon]|nr:MAG: CBS domain-containing protein [Thermoplasmatales archaeon]
MSKGYVLVKEAMKTNPFTVKPKTTVKEAAELMRNKNIGNCIVLEEKPIGIITESDILKKVVAEDLKASEVLVEEIMQTPLIVIDPYVDIEKAMQTMVKCNIRRLPVVENEKLIGIITVKDILRLSPILLEINREWSEIAGRDEAHLKQQIFSGKCEDCGVLSTNLKNVDGRLLCEDCIESLKYDE